ncbi:MAG: DUF4476 domain-containing protein [Flavobacteriales bacterium]|nr:DUF4476 domain-containing protein [Flavobacteriales bacterium]
MKKILLVFIAMISLSAIQAQNCNAVFFNQDGRAFQVTLNGILQNADYQTNVKVTDLSFEGNYKVTINFQDQSIATITKSIYMMEQSTEYSYELKANKKGEYVMRASSMVPIAQAPAAPAQTVVTYTTTPAAPAPTPAPAPTTTATTVTTETVTTSTTVTDNSTGTSENVNMNVSMGGMGVGMNVNVNVTDNGMNTNTDMNMMGANTSTTTTYTETTTVTTSSGYSDDMMSTEPVGEATPVYVMPGYTGPVGCPYPMSEAEFAKVKQSISSKDFSDSKLTVAKQVTNANCLTADQAKQIMLLFDFEDTKLDYAKYAYGHTYDLGNYYRLNDAFEFESSIEELNNYIESQK